MIVNRIAQYLLILLLLLIGKTANCQCVSPAEFIGQIDGINESSKTNAVKIRETIALVSRIKKCIPAIDSTYARAIHRLGDLYRQSGDFERSIADTKEAISTNSSLKSGAERAYLVNSYYNLGLYYSLLYLYPESQTYFDSCISIGLNYPSKRRIVFMAFEQKCYVHFISGDYEKAIDVADRGILVAKSDNDLNIEAILLSQKAQSQLELSQIDEAQLNITRSVQILLSADMPEYLATAYSIYARLSELKKEKGAINYYQKAFAINKRIGNYGQCSRDLMNLGYFYDDELRYSKLAIDRFEEGIVYAKMANDYYQLAGLYNNIGNIYTKQGKHQQALSFFQKGLNTIPIHFADTAISNNPSATDLKLVANDYFILTLLSNKAETLLDLFQVHKDTAKLQLALETYQAADLSIDLMRWKQQGESSKFYWREKAKKIYEKAISVCYYKNATEKAYYFFEKSRAVLLSDGLNEREAKKYIAPADRDMEQSFKIRLFTLNEQLSQISDSTPAYANLKQELLATQDNLEDFKKKLEVKYPQYYNHKYNSVITPLELLKASLAKNGQTLLDFFTGDSILYIFKVSPTDVALTLVRANNYENNVKTILSIIGTPGLLNQQYSAFRQASFALYQQLIKPLKLKTKRIIISSDEQIIPFEMLLYDTVARNAFLIRKHSFSYSYNANLALKENTGEKGRHDFLGLAPVIYAPYLQQQTLLGADLSLQKIKTSFANNRLLTGSDASKQNFLQKFAEYRIVQVYSHAEVDSVGKMPVLYLSDSALILPQIQIQENLHTEMIVLSACKTTIGRQIKGEGIYSIARGFAAAGIPSTITTLWEVDNQATFQLTEKFYSYIQLGYTKDEALQKAKISLIDQTDGMYSLPYYWAGTIVLGNASAIKDLTAQSNLWDHPIFWVSLIIILITAVVVYSRKK